MMPKRDIHLKWQHTGAIFAGGQSKRMGSPKEGVLLWDNRPMIEHVIEVLKKVCKKIIIIGKCEGYDSKDITLLQDITLNLGPVGGLKTLLSSGIDTEYLVVACDQPLLTPELLRKLIKSEVSSKLRLFSYSGFTDINPLPGYYSSSLLSHVQDSIKNGFTAMHEMIENYPSVSWVSITQAEALLLKNVNTPHDLEEVKNR